MDSIPSSSQPIIVNESNKLNLHSEVFNIEIDTNTHGVALREGETCREIGQGMGVIKKVDSRQRAAK